MGSLKETTAAGLQVNRAASAAKDVVRKGEFDAAIAARPTTSTVAASVAAVAHDAATVVNTDSVALTLNGQQISGEVTLSSSVPSGLSTIEGLHADWGTAHTQIPYGDHTHSDSHAPVTAGSSYTAAVTVSAEQVVGVDVVLAPAGNLVSSETGIAVETGVFAAVAHTHDAATASVAGLMSAADKTKLDSLSADVTNYTSTATVNATSIGGEVTMDVITGAGLKIGNGVEVDYTQVPTYGHSHANATATTPGFMSAAQVTALAGVNYIYLGWADLVSSSTPVNFSLTKDSTKTYLAILTSTTVIEAPQASDFAGLWMQITPAT